MLDFAPTLAHIVNPVVVPASSDLHIAQPITFETMRLAQQYARERGISVELYTAEYEADQAIHPDGFIQTPLLTSSVLDYGEFEISRELPLIGDILGRLAHNSADYVIYTNVDIALMPNFYVTVAHLIQQGYDAFVINRRTISTKYTAIADIPMMWAQAGKSHPGHDCFVFKRSALERYQLYQVCIGASLVGRALLLNLIAQSQQFAEFKNLHLTFHLGDDRAWRQDRYRDYTEYNLTNTLAIVEHYKARNELPQHPLIERLIQNPDPEFWLGTTESKTFKEKILEKLQQLWTFS
ncbi:MAG: hypothetical protein AAGG02_09415 [Cyanobacteria bacterium P01_H01_bin.15]